MADATGTLGVKGERMFLGIALDDSCRQAIAKHLESSLDGQQLPGRSVPVENWHITLRFLGSTSLAQRGQVLAYLGQHVRVERFRLQVGGLGAFRGASRASVLWAGVAGDTESLAALADTCETAAQHAGFAQDDRPFHPHLTLSRIRPSVDVRPLIDLVPNARISLDVADVTLYRSVLGDGPAQYEVVDTVPL